MPNRQDGTRRKWLHRPLSSFLIREFRPKVEQIKNKLEMSTQSHSNGWNKTKTRILLGAQLKPR
jgi:hypothetical protein